MALTELTAGLESRMHGPDAGGETAAVAWLAAERAVLERELSQLQNVLATPNGGGPNRARTAAAS
jgi:hypothetical protein